MFEIPNTLSVFSANLDGTKLAKILVKVDKVIQYSDADKLTDDLQLLVSANCKLFVVGRTSDTLCCHYVCESEGEGAAYVDFLKLKKMLDAKPKAEISYDKQAVTVKSGRSKSTLNAKSVSLYELETIERDLKLRNMRSESSFTLERSDISKIVIAANMLGIKDVFSNTRSAVCVTASDGQAKVVSSTAWSASSTTFESKGFYRFAIYSDMIQIIDALVSDDLNLYVDMQGFIVATSTDFIAAFPPAPVTEASYGQYDLFISMLGKAPAKFQANGDELKKVLTKIESLFIKKGDNPNGLCKIGDNKVKISYACDDGSDSQILSCKNKGEAEFKIDIRLLSTVLRAVKQISTVTLTVYGVVGQYKFLKFDTVADNLGVSFGLYIPQ